MQQKEEFTYLPSDNPKVPAAEFPFRHSQPVQMRFTDIDMLGHLNNNVYLTFMDLAKVEYFAAVLPEGMDWRSINAVVVHISPQGHAVDALPHNLAPEIGGMLLGEGVGMTRLLHGFVENLCK